jgi:branched-chain amino acid transport system substrate-binding protein
MTQNSVSPNNTTTTPRKRQNTLIAVVIVVVVLVVIAGGLSYYYTSAKKKPTAPSDILIGMPYASSGSFALSSGFVKTGFQMWVNQTNAKGGLYLSEYGKTIPIKMVYLDDQSSTSTVATDYTNIITQDHVNILVSDFGSTLVAPGIPIAKDNKVVFWDTTGSTPSFFNSSNPYLVDLAIQSSALWPLSLSEFLVAQRSNITRVAILYTSQDFTTAQAATVDSYLTSHGITPVYYQGTSDSSSSEYLTTLAAINSTHPDAVLEFGYDTNDIAFLTAMNSGHYHFNMTFTIYASLETSLIASSSPSGSLNYTYTYASPPLVSYSSVTLGPNTTQFVNEWKANNSGKLPNYNNMAGFASGTLLGKIITVAGSLNQTALRAAANETSGATTMIGPFIINKTTGIQLGEGHYLMQFQGNTSHPVVVYPTNVSTGSAVYPPPSILNANFNGNSTPPLAPLSNYQLPDPSTGRQG